MDVDGQAVELMSLQGCSYNLQKITTQTQTEAVG